MSNEKYVLKLFVSGITPKIEETLNSLRKALDKSAPNQYELDVISVLENPEHAVKAAVVATPTLMKELPAPVVKIVGQLENEERVLVALGLQKKEQ